MSRIIFTLPSGAETEVAGSDDQSLMQVAVSHDVPGIEGECGGELSCGTCHVYVDQPWYAMLPPLGNDEQDMVDVMEDPRPTSRLGCQVRLRPGLDGMRVTVAGA